MNDISRREKLAYLLKRDALQFGQFPLSAGGFSSYYIDGRLVTLSADGARLVALEVLDILVDFPSVTAIGGPCIGADPIVCATVALAGLYPHSGLHGLCGFLVRKTAKEHGTKSLIEGPLRPGSTVAIVDDVATSGNSIISAINAVEELGCKVAVVIVVVDRLMGAREALFKRWFEYRSIFTIRDLGIV